MPQIDIVKATEEITKLERLQAQIELREAQCKEEEIETKLEELSNAIAERLTFISNLNTVKMSDKAADKILDTLL